MVFILLLDTEAKFRTEPLPEFRTNTEFRTEQLTELRTCTVSHQTIRSPKCAPKPLFTYLSTICIQKGYIIMDLSKTKSIISQSYNQADQIFVKL